MSCPYSGLDNTRTQICSCKDQIDNLAHSIKTYEDTLTNNANERNKYNTDYSNWQNNHNNWINNRANKKNELENEQKIWNNCVLWTGVYGHDDWCQGDTGFGQQTGAGGYGCTLGQGKGECKRTSNQVNSELDQWATGSNAEPQEPPQPNLVDPQAPSSNVQCCGISFSNLTSNSLSFNDISQQCNQASPSPPSDSGLGLGSGADSSSLQDKLSSLLSNQTYVIGGVVVIIISIIFCSILLLSNNDD
jgi:hypothetical protein